MNLIPFGGVTNGRRTYQTTDGRYVFACGVTTRADHLRVRRVQVWTVTDTTRKDALGYSATVVTAGTLDSAKARLAKLLARAEVT